MDINMAFGGNMGPQTSTQTPNADRPWTQTWPLVAGCAQTPFISAWSLVATWPTTSSWPQASAKISNINMAIGSNLDHEYQHRHGLQWSLRPRCGPWQQHRPRHHMVSGGSTGYSHHFALQGHHDLQLPTYPS